MPKTLTAIPKWAMTMPKMGNGVRSNLRPRSGNQAATPKARDKAMPNSGNMPISGASFHTVIPLHNRIAAEPMSQYLIRFRSSRRQRNIGPISKASINSTMTGTVALLKYGGPTEILSPMASAASG